MKKTGQTTLQGTQKGEGEWYNEMSACRKGGQELKKLMEFMYNTYLKNTSWRSHGT